VKPRYKPSADSKVELERAKRWYAGLDYTDKKSVMKKIARSRLSHNGGVELIYKLLRRM